MCSTGMAYNGQILLGYLYTESVFFVFFYKARIEKNNKSKYNTVMLIQYLKAEKESDNYVDNQADF